MAIQIINEEKNKDKRNKSYYITDDVISDIDELKTRTNAEDINELFEKMVAVTKEHLKAELKSKNNNG